MKFNLRQLRYFVAVVECGGVAQASRRLFIAQPSVAAAIRSLEESFGVQLCIRHHAQGISLTPAGERFYRDAVKLLRNAHAFEQNVFAESELVKGVVSLGCYGTMAPLFVPRLIASFRRHYPGIEFQIDDGEQQQLSEGLRTGRYDLVITYDQGLGEEIQRTALCPTQRPYVLLPHGHVLAEQSALSLNRLSSEPMVVLDVEPSRGYFLGLFRRANLDVRIAFSSPSIEMVRGLVGHGFGFTLLVTKPHADYTYDGKALAVRELSDEVETTTLVAATLCEITPTAPTRAFIEYCSTALQRSGNFSPDSGKCASPGGN